MIKILVVEDDRNLNKSICLFLKQKGFEIQECFDGEEALDMLYKSTFDLIISDIMMPGFDGYRLLENVRKLDKNIPFVFMTAKEDFPSKQKGFNSGVDDYLVKPVDLQELYLRINALLRRANINVEKKLVVGNFTMDVEEHMAYIGEEEVNFTSREFDIVFKLLYIISYSSRSVEIKQDGIFFTAIEIFGIAYNASQSANNMFFHRFPPKQAAAQVPPLI